MVLVLLAEMTQDLLFTSIWTLLIWDDLYVSKTYTFNGSNFELCVCVCVCVIFALKPEHLGYVYILGLRFGPE